MRAGLPLVEERAILWHELAHAVRGDTGCLDPVLDTRQEAAAWRYAARRAVPLRALLAALEWSTQADEIADQLKTTPELLRWRMLGLHPAERAAVRRAVETKEDPCP